MPSTVVSRKVLIVLSGDYGEFAMARCFVAGQEFAETSLVLAPPALGTALADDVSGTRRYGNERELVSAIEEYSPNVVMLFSGYLLAASSPLTTAAVRRLVNGLQRRGVAVVTSDPLLGLAGRMRPSMLDFSGSGNHLSKRRQRCLALLRALLTTIYYRRIDRILRDVPRLYPGPVSADVPGQRKLTFFNSAITEGIREPDALIAGSPEAKWVFLLSEVDLTIQENFHGTSFPRLVAKRLTDARRNSRLPVLIAPQRLLNSVASELDGAVGADLQAPQSFDRFTETLTAAEFVFYWNAFSFSTILRILRGKPVFFFDKGHMSRLIRPYFDLAVNVYLAGRAPVFLDQDAPLSFSALDTLASSWLQDADFVTAYHRRAPPPESVLDELARA